MNDITFTSRIKAAPRPEFVQQAFQIGRKNLVDAPWTLKESVKATGAYTKGVCDCSVLGLTDGKDVLMLHLNPANGATPNEIKNFITKKIDIKNPYLQAIIIGAKDTRISQLLSENLTKIVKDFDIPLTELKTSAPGCWLDLAYSSVSDEWLISCEKIDELIEKGIKDSKTIFNKIFQKVELADCDEFV